MSPPTFDVCWSPLPVSPAAPDLLLDLVVTPAGGVPLDMLLGVACLPRLREHLPVPSPPKVALSMGASLPQHDLFEAGSTAVAAADHPTDADITAFLRALVAPVRAAAPGELILKLLPLLRYAYLDLDEPHMTYYTHPVIPPRVAAVRVESWRILQARVRWPSGRWRAVSLQTAPIGPHCHQLDLEIGITLTGEERHTVQLTLLPPEVSFSRPLAAPLALSTGTHTLHHWSYAELRRVLHVLFRQVVAGSSAEALLKLALFFRVSALERLLAAPLGGGPTLTAGQVGQNPRGHHRF